MKQEDKTQDLEFIQKVYVDNIQFTYIKKSNIHGQGLFASDEIKKDTILGFLDGQVMSWDHWECIRDEIQQQMGKYKKYILMEYNIIDPKTLLVRPFRTKYSLINHSKDANVQIEYNPMRIVAIEDIKQDEELRLDYNNEPMREGMTHSDKKDYLK